MIWIGADWDSQKCVVAVLVEDGSTRKCSVKRSPSAVREFLATFGVDDVTVGLEAGDELWRKLWSQVGVTVVVFDGKKARRYSESLRSSGARDDARAAEDLLHMVQSATHRQASNTHLPPALHGLELLARAAQTLAETVVREQNRLRSLLRQYYPSVGTHLGSKLQNRWLLNALAAAPTVHAWSSLTLDAQSTLLAGSHRQKRQDVATIFSDNWNAVEPEEKAQIEFVIRTQVSALQAALARQRETKKAIDEAMKAVPVAELVTAIVGIGTCLGAAISIAAGKASGSKNRDAIAIKLGAAPVTMRSGKLGDARPRVVMRKSADSLMRQASYLIGLHLAANYIWAKTQFDAIRARGIKAASAHRTIVRSFSRILFAMIRDNTAFDEPKYIAALKARGVDWAMPL